MEAPIHAKSTNLDGFSWDFGNMEMRWYWTNRETTCVAPVNFFTFLLVADLSFFSYFSLFKQLKQQQTLQTQYPLTGARQTRWLLQDLLDGDLGVLSIEIKVGMNE